jgi:crotonobetainyl-CoA:carnitine CoA-transferase CaiB-like acyl-CoA transferase
VVPEQEGQESAAPGRPAPLHDVRIVAVEQYGAGPFGSLLLADLGAEVIKIEDAGRGGDVGRHVPPSTGSGDSLFFESFNRNKRSLALDLSTDAGRDVLRDLIAVSDCVYSNLRGDVPRKLGLTFDQLKDINPRIVCCSLSGYGMDGSRAARPAYDYMLQAECGWMALTGDPEGPPTKSGLSLVDLAGGFSAAISVLAGIHQARRDGRGMDCDLALYDVGVGLLSYVATWELSAGLEISRIADSAHPSIVPFQRFDTADGSIVVGCPKEIFFERLRDLLSGRGLDNDALYGTFALRYENRELLLPILRDAFIERTTDQWLEILGQSGVPCAPVNSVREALADPHLAERDLIVETLHPTLGPVRSVMSPPRVGAERPNHRRGPHQDEDASYVLRELLGYEQEQIDALRARDTSERPPAARTSEGGD